MANRQDVNKGTLGNTSGPNHCKQSWTVAVGSMQMCRWVGLPAATLATLAWVHLSRKHPFSSAETGVGMSEQRTSTKD